MQSIFSGIFFNLDEGYFFYSEWKHWFSIMEVEETHSPDLSPHTPSDSPKFTTWNAPNNVAGSSNVASSFISYSDANAVKLTPGQEMHRRSYNEPSPPFDTGSTPPGLPTATLLSKSLNALNVLDYFQRNNKNEQIFSPV
uniref:Uncharacterized protein n=1 Tax=Cacopsylla melanoneura TaxID=428564 RepID=A0A8D8Z0I2_9HEMI